MSKLKMNCSSCAKDENVSVLWCTHLLCSKCFETLTQRDYSCPSCGGYLHLMPTEITKSAITAEEVSRNLKTELQKVNAVEVELERSLKDELVKINSFHTDITMLLNKCTRDTEKHYANTRESLSEYRLTISRLEISLQEHPELAGEISKMHIPSLEVRDIKKVYECDVKDDSDLLCTLDLHMWRKISCTVSHSKLSPGIMYSKFQSSILKIEIETQDGQLLHTQSGFFIETGLIVTTGYRMNMYEHRESEHAYIPTDCCIYGTVYKVNGSERIQRYKLLIYKVEENILSCVIDYSDVYNKNLVSVNNNPFLWFTDSNSCKVIENFNIIEGCRKSVNDTIVTGNVRGKDDKGIVYTKIRVNDGAEGSPILDVHGFVYGIVIGRMEKSLYAVGLAECVFKKLFM